MVEEHITKRKSVAEATNLRKYLPSEDEDAAARCAYALTYEPLGCHPIYAQRCVAERRWTF